MALWYAQYRLSDNRVTGAGYVDPALLEKEDHAVSIAQPGKIPSDLRSRGGALNYQYNTETNSLEPVS